MKKLNGYQKSVLEEYGKAWLCYANSCPMLIGSETEEQVKAYHRNDKARAEIQTAFSAICSFARLDYSFSYERVEIYSKGELLLTVVR